MLQVGFSPPHLVWEARLKAVSMHGFSELLGWSRTKTSTRFCKGGVWFLMEAFCVKGRIDDTKRRDTEIKILSHNNIDEAQSQKNRYRKDKQWSESGLAAVLAALQSIPDMRHKMRSPARKSSESTDR